MKLFSLPDGTVDRKDRAQWITQPFDLAFLVPTTPITPLNNYSSIYAGLIGQINSNEDHADNLRRLLNGGFFSGWMPEKEIRPFLVLNHIASVNDLTDSCHYRYEEEEFQFNIYDRSLDHLVAIIESLFELFDEMHPFTVTNLAINSIFWNGSMINEEEPGVWHGVVGVFFNVGRQIDTTYQLTVTSDTNFFNAIYSRFKNATELSSRVLGFYQGFGKEGLKFPYITIDDLVSEEEWRHSQGLITKHDFSFGIYSRTLSELLELIDLVHKVYDFATLNINSIRSLNLEWEITSIIEVEPGIWYASMKYCAYLERQLNSSQGLFQGTSRTFVTGNVGSGATSDIGAET